MHLAEEDNLINIKNDKDVKVYLEKYGYNFKRIDEVKLLGQGGENMIFRVTPFLPLEIVAKIPLPSEDTVQSDS